MSPKGFLSLFNPETAGESSRSFRYEQGPEVTIAFNRLNTVRNAVEGMSMHAVIDEPQVRSITPESVNSAVKAIVDEPTSIGSSAEVHTTGELTQNPVNPEDVARALVSEAFRKTEGESDSRLALGA